MGGLLCGCLVFSECDEKHQPEAKCHLVLLDPVGKVRQSNVVQKRYALKGEGVVVCLLA